MKPVSLLFKRSVRRGEVCIRGVRFYAAALQLREGEKLEIAVGEDGRVFAGSVELERVA